MMFSKKIGLRLSESRRTANSKFHHVLSFYTVAHRGAPKTASPQENHSPATRYLPLEVAIVSFAGDGKRIENYCRTIPKAGGTALLHDVEFFKGIRIRGQRPLKGDLPTMANDRGTVPEDELDEWIVTQLDRHKVELGLVTDTDVRISFVNLGWNTEIKYKLPVATHEMRTLQRVTDVSLVDSKRARSKACQQCNEDKCWFGCPVRAAHMTIDVLEEDIWLMDNHTRKYKDLHRCMTVTPLRVLRFAKMLLDNAEQINLSDGKSKRQEQFSAVKAFLNKYEPNRTGELRCVFHVAEMSTTSTGKSKLMFALTPYGEKGEILYVPVHWNDFDATCDLKSIVRKERKLPMYLMPYITMPKRHQQQEFGC